MKSALKITQAFAQLTLAATLIVLVNGCDRKEQQNVQNPPSTEPQIEGVKSSNGSLDGIWKIQYSINGIVYQSELEMRGNDGTMLTHFFDVNTNQSKIVEQTIELKPSAQGIVLLGSHPVYPNTETSYPNYSPDNFLFKINPDGSKIFYTCDNAGMCSPVEMEYVGSKQ
jgi:hypothetical protein